MEYRFNYIENDGTQYVAVCKVAFSNTINAKDLISGNIDMPTYTREYRFNCDAKIQENNRTICNAICDTLFGAESEDKQVVARYIVDNGELVGDEKLGLNHGFTVIEVTDEDVQESTIKIKKNIVEDLDYISKLQDTNKYKTQDEKSYNFAGTKIENNNEKF